MVEYRRKDVVFHIADDFSAQTWNGQMDPFFLPDDFVLQRAVEMRKAKA